MHFCPHVHARSGRGGLIAMKRRHATLAPVETAIVIHTLLVYAFFASDPEGLFISQ